MLLLRPHALLVVAVDAHAHRSVVVEVRQTNERRRGTFAADVQAARPTMVPAVEEGETGRAQRALVRVGLPHRPRRAAQLVHPLLKVVLRARAQVVDPLRRLAGDLKVAIGGSLRGHDCRPGKVDGAAGLQVAVAAVPSAILFPKVLELSSLEDEETLKLGGGEGGAKEHIGGERAGKKRGREKRKPRQSVALAVGNDALLTHLLPCR